MHIAIDALLLKNQNAGTGFYTHRLLVALAHLSTPHRFTVFVDADYQKSGEFESSSIQIKKLSLRGVAHRVFWEQLILPHQLKKISADVALYPFFIKPLVTRVPSVTVIHDALVKAYPELVEIGRRIYLDTFIAASVKSASHLTTVSEFARRDIARFYRESQEKISVVPAAPDEIFSRPVTDEESRLILERYGVSFKKFFLTVGTLSKYKNYLEVLRAFHAVYEMDSSARLVMIGGDGNDTNSVEQFVSQHQLTDAVYRVHYAPPEDLRGFYASASALVMASHYESFGMPILEAMRIGCPVIVANRAAMPEVAGNAGLRYETTEDLCEHLRVVWKSGIPRTDMIIKGKLRATEFSWENSARAMIDVIERICSLPN